MRNIYAVFLKQFMSLIKNPGMIVQALIFLGLVLVMSFLIGAEDDKNCYDCIPAYVCTVCLENDTDTPNPSLTGLFTIMFVGLAMVGSASALVLEDKTTVNLRFMAMANVKPKQYLLGTGISLLIISFVLLVLFSIVGRYFGMQMLLFLAVTTVGAVVSILLGITVGLSKAPYITAPLSIILGMGPMLSNFNDTLAHILRFTYTQQINLAISDLDADLTTNFVIIAANGVAILLLFLWMRRKGTLD